MFCCRRDGLPFYLKSYCSPPVILVTLVCNTFVCIVLTRKSMLNPTNVILLGMALADLFTAFFPLPFYILAVFLTSDHRFYGEYAQLRVESWAPGPAPGPAEAAPSKTDRSIDNLQQNTQPVSASLWHAVLKKKEIVRLANEVVVCGKTLPARIVTCREVAAHSYSTVDKINVNRSTNTTMSHRPQGSRSLSFSTTTHNSDFKFDRRTPTAITNTVLMKWRYLTSKLLWKLKKEPISHRH